MNDSELSVDGRGPARSAPPVQPPFVLFILLGAGLLATAGCEGGGLISCEGSTPESASSVAPEPGPPAGTLLIDVDSEHISVDGEPVVSLQRGRVAVEDKKYEASLVIRPLKEALEARRKRAEPDRDAGSEPIERIRLRTHPLTRSRLYSEVIYTAGAAELGWQEPLEWRVCPVPDCPPVGSASSSVVEFTERIPHTHDHEPRRERARPLYLTLVPRKEGIDVAATGAQLVPREGCPEDGPTLCLRDPDIDVGAALEASRLALYAAEKGDDRTEEAMQPYGRALAAYNGRRLYNLVAELKAQYPKASKVRLSIYKTDPDLPLGLYRELLRHVRVRLPRARYDTDQAYRAARDQVGDDAEPLFDGVCPSNGKCWKHFVADKIGPDDKAIEEVFGGDESDDDGLTDGAEELFGTNPADPDIDDGAIDGQSRGVGGENE